MTSLKGPIFFPSSNINRVLIGYELKILIIFWGQLGVDVHELANQLQDHIEKTRLYSATSVDGRSQRRKVMVWDDISKSFY